MMPFIKSLLKIILGVIIAIPLLLYPLLYFVQDKLIFAQRKMDNQFLNWIRREYPNAEVQITTPDNVTLHGWYVKNSPEKQSPLLIFFGGNAEEVSGHVMELDQFKGWSLLLVNYRGYGLSEGSPSEKNLFNDAVLLYDTFSKRADVDPNKIVAFGRSLGTGVAVYLASQRPLKGLILVSPYDSLRGIAQEIYPYVPVSWLLKHHFDSQALAPSINIPMLALIAEEDRIIPPSHSVALIEAWGGVTQQQWIQDSDHNNITMGRGYWETIRAFLNQLKDQN
jgi:pimeloyl-ACP methyl ester carboxylesterase